MGAVAVVGVGEFVEERLEFVEVVGAALGGEPFFEGLLETFDFPAGGGVVGRGVLLFGAEVSEAGLEERFCRLSRRRSGWCRPWRCR